MSFDRPLRATDHCRHYSYETGLKGRGPLCALEVDLSAPGASRCCWPEPTGVCTKREEYTSEERDAWALWRQAGDARLIAAIRALPRPIPLRTGGNVKCPSCPDGQIHYGRWEGGAELRCSTPNCCGAHFNIKRGVDWPTLA